MQLTAIFHDDIHVKLKVKRFYWNLTSHDSFQLLLAVTSFWFSMNREHHCMLSPYFCFKQVHYNHLHEWLNHKWDFIVMQATEQYKQVNHFILITLFNSPQGRQTGNEGKEREIGLACSKVKSRTQHRTFPLHRFVRLTKCWHQRLGQILMLVYIFLFTYLNMYLPRIIWLRSQTFLTGYLYLVTSIIITRNILPIYENSIIISSSPSPHSKTVLQHPPKRLKQIGTYFRKLKNS